MVAKSLDEVRAAFKDDKLAAAFGGRFMAVYASDLTFVGHAPTSRPHICRLAEHFERLRGWSTGPSRCQMLSSHVAMSMTLSPPGQLGYRSILAASFDRLFDAPTLWRAEVVLAIDG